MKRIMMMFCCVALSSSIADAACLTSATATAPASAFTDNGDGTVTHNKTQLMWKQCSEGLSGVGTCATGTATFIGSWQLALQAAETLNNGAGFAGYNDWRMPNIKELDLIVEHQCSAPSIDSVVFPGTVSGTYWSTTPYPPVPANVMGMNFNDSNDGVLTKLASGYLRLVRGGQ